MRWISLLVVFACAGSTRPRSPEASPAPPRQHPAVADTQPPPPVESPSVPAPPPPPTACPANEKLFRCHALALDVHLGVDRKPDPAAARALYADACNKGHAPSCNNLGVIAIRHPELAAGIDPAALFATACKKMHHAACDNESRLARSRELSVRLMLVDALTADRARVEQLESLACAAGDVFRCTDAASRDRAGSLLAAECRAGRHTQCFDAATATTDASAGEALLKLGCASRDGKTCHALAVREQARGAKPATIASLWKAACSDDDFDASPDAIAARNQACEQWSAVARAKHEQLAIAALTEPRCAKGDEAACATAFTSLDRAGASARAFAILKRQCDEGTRTTACAELADRYALGLGTPRSIAKRIELAGPECAPPASWPVCKAVAEHHLARPDDRGLGVATYEAFCKADNNEACYLGARASEIGALSCAGTWNSAEDLHATYERLCKDNYRDTCKRLKSACAVAMRDLVKPRSTCSAGVGDGSFQPTVEYHAVLALCPKQSWTHEVQQIMSRATP